MATQIGKAIDRIVTEAEQQRAGFTPSDTGKLKQMLAELHSTIVKAYTPSYAGTLRTLYSRTSLIDRWIRFLNSYLSSGALERLTAATQLADVQMQAAHLELLQLLDIPVDFSSAAFVLVMDRNSDILEDACNTFAIPSHLSEEELDAVQDIFLSKGGLDFLAFQLQYVSAYLQARRAAQRTARERRDCDQLEGKLNQKLALLYAACMQLLGQDWSGKGWVQRYLSQGIDTPRMVEAVCMAAQAGAGSMAVTVNAGAVSQPAAALWWLQAPHASPELAGQMTLQADEVESHKASHCLGIAEIV
ncbi:hypothetical protein WJX72_008530 [[Myrmecia] bisecta]|uniref:Uncharacterized protein n=1 Tax=[Myrmecia] bisecta TaxID=41462 RepID=A0AAW1P537_9CHLO